MGNQRMSFVGTGVGIRAADKMGWMAAASRAMGGDYQGALSALVNGARPQNMMSVAAMGWLYQAARQSVGTVTIGKIGKTRITVF